MSQQIKKGRGSLFVYLNENFLRPFNDLDLHLLLLDPLLRLRRLQLVRQLCLRFLQK